MRYVMVHIEDNEDPIAALERVKNQMKERLHNGNNPYWYTHFDLRKKVQNENTGLSSGEIMAREMDGDYRHRAKGKK